jgi:hypothetical protein
LQKTKKYLESETMADGEKKANSFAKKFLSKLFGLIGSVLLVAIVGIMIASYTTYGGEIRFDTELLFNQTFLIVFVVDISNFLS